MVDRLLARTLRDVLATYCENGDELANSVSLSSWTGTIQLHNLKLKKSVADSLSLPLDIVLCSIGSLELSIPWKSLKQDPVRVCISDICVLLKCNYKLKQQSKLSSTQAIKQAQLAAADAYVDLLNNAASTAQAQLQGATSKQSSFFASYFGGLKEAALNTMLQSVLRNIVNNFECEVKRIHIRYEDTESSPVSDFCVGTTIDSLRISSPTTVITPADTNSRSSSNSSGNSKSQELQTFTYHNSNDPNTAIFTKSIAMKHQCVYWNSLSINSPTVCGRPLCGKFHADITHIMMHTLMPTHRTQFLDLLGHRYLLKPMDTDVDSYIAINVVEKTVKADLRVSMPSMDVTYSDQQGMEMFALSSNLSNYAETMKHSEFRPLVSVMKDPKAWWRCVGVVVGNCCLLSYFVAQICHSFGVSPTPTHTM